MKCFSRLFILIQSDGRTHGTNIRTSSGGVGRNVAEALAKLGHNPVLVSALGNDLFGRELMRHFEEIGMVSKQLSILKGFEHFKMSFIYSHK
jgi:sugar/nucleoside kinase (ribokinase family)